MPLMTLEKTRADINPVLTSIVQGFVPSEFAGIELFPEVTVPKRAGKIITFGKEDFALYDTRRSPAAATKRFNLNYGNQDYSLYQDAIEGELPVEYIEESAGINVNLQQEILLSARVRLDQRLEYDRAAIATSAANYDNNHKVTLSGTSKWSDYANSHPARDIRAWNQAIRASTGVYGNVVFMGPRVFEYLIDHPEILDKIKYTSSATVNQQTLAQMWNVDKVVVGRSLILNNTTDEFTDIWGDIVILAYVPQTISSRRQPSFGYTYTLQGYPIAENPYYDNNHRTWLFPIFAERAPYLTGSSSGFLAQSVI